MDMRVNIAGVEWKNPVTVASGTFGSGEEFSEFVDLNRLGAVTTKGVANVPWPGNPTPRVAEVYGGMMNAIGLQNPGIDLFCKRDIPFLKKYDTKIIVNVCGHAPEEYLAVVERLADEPIDMMEINNSCPNVNAGFLAFGQDAKHVEELTAQIKKIAKQPIIMKLTPNVTDITEIAKAAEAGGADALSLINTLTGMKIDINRRTFAVANKTGGVSGPVVHPIAVRMVYQTAQAVDIPIIGMGGIATPEDAIEMIKAGLKAADIVKISREEVDLVFGDISDEEASRIIREKYKVRLLYITKGNKGCYYETSGVKGSMGIYDLGKPLDTTGAGDIFGGSAAYAYLKKNKSIEELDERDLKDIVAFATVASGISTMKLGGISSIPALEEVLKALSGFEK